MMFHLFFKNRRNPIEWGLPAVLRYFLKVQMVIISERVSCFRGDTTYCSKNYDSMNGCNKEWLGREVSTLNETCYHCGHEATKGSYVTFYEKEHEHDEFLCSECYVEWLESMKG
jgi:hypothetical protein